MRQKKEFRYQEKFSEVFLSAVVSICGFQISSPKPDAGLDFHVYAKDLGGEFFDSSDIHIQLKSAYNYEIKDNFIKYRLSRHNYLDLIKKENVPRMLVLVLVNKDENNWMELTHEKCSIYKCIYWYNLTGKEKDERQSIPLEIPLKNILLPKTLKKMMQNLCDGVAYDEL